MWDIDKTLHMCIYRYISLYIHPMVLSKVRVKELYQKIKKLLIMINLKIKKIRKYLLLGKTKSCHT